MGICILNHILREILYVASHHIHIGGVWSLCAIDISLNLIIWVQLIQIIVYNDNYTCSRLENHEYMYFRSCNMEIYY